MKVSALALGFLTRIPGFNGLRYKIKGGGSTDSAAYCYSVWLRHLVLARESGMNGVPKVVAELGPGESIGVGLAALICGTERYYALDVVNYEDVSQNLAVFDLLVEMFRTRMDIPGGDEFPDIKPTLKSYSFPGTILTCELLDAALAESRLNRIRQSITGCEALSPVITYKVPWLAPDIIQPASVDMIFSQAVLEHVDDLGNTYDAMSQWLAPGGFLSHQIDFKCHGTAIEWNGHWRYSTLMWSMIKGGRPYLINRQPYSVHIDFLSKSGVRIVFDQRSELVSRLEREQLALDFRDIKDIDMITAGVYLLAVKDLESSEHS